MKNGFTLVELLSILVILSVISIIAIPEIKESIDNAKNSTYDNQVDAIKKAADSYFMASSFDINEDDEKVIYLNDILKKGYLEDKDVKNPILNEEMTGCVLVTLSNNQYHYQYLDNIKECQKYTNLSE